MAKRKRRSKMHHKAAKGGSKRSSRRVRRGARGIGRVRAGRRSSRSRHRL